jgi:hypothetical protein
MLFPYVTLMIVDNCGSVLSQGKPEVAEGHRLHACCPGGHMAVAPLGPVE